MTSFLHSTLALALFAAAPIDADLVVLGGTIYDGAERQGYVGDVAIRGDRIVAVGEFEVAGNPRTIDAAGLIVCPGFIDLHSHSDEGMTKIATRLNANYLVQGVTTIISGNCGAGPVDVATFYKAMDDGGIGTNVGHLVPHGSVRAKVMGDANRPPSPTELQKICALVEKGMAEGAWGLSTGLIYTPGSFAKTDELVAVAEAVALHRGIYVSHIRNEGSQLLESLDEILAIGERAKLPVHVSHLKVTGRSNWGLAPEAIQKLRDARTAGRQVTADQYPYTASSTSLSAMVIPDELRSWEKLKKALDDPQRKEETRAAIQRELDERDGGESLVVANFAHNRLWQGKSLAAIAKETQTSPLEVVLTILGNGGAAMVSFGMQEDEVRLFMRESWVATASDGSSVPLDSPAQPHPRAFGCFARKIGHYAIDGKIVPLEQAIRSASGLPADILGLSDRGYLKANMRADIAVLDPKIYRDLATYDKPLQWATGAKLVLVNGKIAVQDGKPTGELAGRVLRHQASK